MPFLSPPRSTRSGGSHRIPRDIAARATRLLPKCQNKRPGRAGPFNKTKSIRSEAFVAALELGLRLLRRGAAPLVSFEHPRIGRTVGRTFGMVGRTAPAAGADERHRVGL